MRIVKNMNSKYRKVLAATAVVAAIVVMLAIYMGWSYQSMAAYNAKLSEADQLLEAEDYANAVLKYQEAIGDKPKEEEGYIRLVAAYRVSGHDDYALQTVEQALVVLPDSEKLLNLRDELSGTKSAVAVVLDQTTLDSLGAMSYHDYSSKNGVVSKTTEKDGSISVRIRGIDAELVYSNTNDQPNAVNGNSPSPDSLPAYVRFDNIMSILGGGDSVSYDELKNLELDSLSTDKNQEYGTYVSFKKGLYSFEIQSSEDGTISKGAKNRVYIPGPNEKSGGTEASGRVIDAVTGDGVANASLEFSVSGGQKYKTVTDSKGNFSIKAISGDCSVDCKADGYIEETKSLYIPSYSSDWSCEIVMSPDIEGGMARIVLSWGASPGDLDSHLIGNGIHTWFGEMVSAKAGLDLDDRDGYGPETTTIYDLKGDYTFVVHDFDTTGNLADSGAEVTVYLPGEDPQTISISGSGSSDTWVVFELNDGKLNVINSIRDYDLDVW